MKSQLKFPFELENSKLQLSRPCIKSKNKLMSSTNNYFLNLWRLYLAWPKGHAALTRLHSKGRHGNK